MVRVIRRVFGVLLALVGLIVAVVGGVAAFWLIGPDNTVYSGDQHLSSKGLAIASAPDLLNRHGPVLHVDARSGKNQPVFVGVARDFDVSSYLKGTGHTKLVQVQYPISLSTQDEKGTAGPLAAPGTLDWWVAKANGAGTQSIAWPIEDGPYDVVIMNADGKTAPDVQVNLGIEIPKAFSTALGIFAAGIILLALGIFLVLLRKRTPKAPRNTNQFDPNQNPQGPGPQHPRPQQQAPVRRVLSVGVVLGLATACAAVPAANSVTVLTRPAVSDAAAAAVIKHYNDVNNKANHSRDGKLIATVEGGNLVRESLAGYKIDQAAGAKVTAPFRYSDTTIGAPQYGSYPMTFVSSSAISGSKDYRNVGLWERESAGSPWMLTFAAGVPTAAKLPDLTGLRPATKADDTKLAAAPQAAATGLAAYLTAGSKSPRSAAFAPNADITKMLVELAGVRAAQGDDRKAVRSIADVFSAPKASPAFMTRSGTALVLVTLTCDHTLMVASNYNFAWAALPMTAFSPATAKYESALTSSTLHDLVLVIPPKGKGKIQIASHESQLIDAGGY